MTRIDVAANSVENVDGSKPEREQVVAMATHNLADRCLDLVQRLTGRVSRHVTTES